eukprot:EG_transcript_9181
MEFLYAQRQAPTATANNRLRWAAALGLLGAALLLWGTATTAPAVRQALAAPASSAGAARTLSRSSTTLSTVVPVFTTSSIPATPAIAVYPSETVQGEQAPTAALGLPLHGLWPVVLAASLALGGWLLGAFQQSSSPMRQEEAAIFAVTSKKKKAAAKPTKPKAAPIDTKALLRRSEKDYNELTETYGHRETDADVVLAEYVVAVRTKPGGRAEPALSGWVPICSIAVVANDLVHKQLNKVTLIACLCREIGETLAQSSPTLRTYPRTDLEYSLEPMNSWETYVLERKNSKDVALFAELGLEPGADARAIKLAYRKLASQLHPDLHGADPELQEANTARMKRIQEAYSTLGGGYGETRDCWYAALGGRARTDFSGPLDLTGVKMGGELLALTLPFEMGGLRCAVSQLSSSITSEFFQINVMKAREAAVAAAAAATAAPTAEGE